MSLPTSAKDKPDRKVKILKDKAKVFTRAIFWKIPHKTKPDEVHLKIGRYNKGGIDPTKQGWDSITFEGPETENPKSELTLDSEEFLALIRLLQEEYEPFKDGAKVYLPLDTPLEEKTGDQLRAFLSQPDTDVLIDFMAEHKIVPDQLLKGLEHVKRVKAVEAFAQMLEENLVEHAWQEWFERNTWVLGSQYIKIIEDRAIDTENIADFLAEAFDGFLDILEIKRPAGDLKFWATSQDHGNYIPSIDLTKAITQATRYIYEVELEANSQKFYERVGFKTVKPRCTLIFGRSDKWNEKQKESFRILNSSYHNLSIMTYDHVLRRAKSMLQIL